jgi:SM-20-related protein
MGRKRVHCVGVGKSAILQLALLLKTVLCLITTTPVPSFHHQRLPEWAVQKLHRDRVVVVPGYLEAAACEALRNDMEQLREAGLFRQAGVGRTSTHRRDMDVRLTESCWLFPPPPPSLGDRAARRELYAIVSDLTQQLSTPLRPLNRWEPELAYLHYPEGGYYKRHFDVPAALQLDGRGRVASEERRVSFLLYLNTGWDAERGGELRVYAPLDEVAARRRRVEGQGGGMEISEAAGHVWQDVVPEGGTLVCFYSDSVEHEVKPTKVERQVIVGWLRGACPAAA